jgi:hypothetical protein
MRDQIAKIKPQAPKPVMRIGFTDPKINIEYTFNTFTELTGYLKALTDAGTGDVARITIILK